MFSFKSDLALPLSKSDICRSEVLQSVPFFVTSIPHSITHRVHRQHMRKLSSTVERTDNTNKSDISVLPCLFVCLFSLSPFSLSDLLTPTPPSAPARKE